MKRSSYLIPIFALYFVSINLGNNLAESSDVSETNAIQKLFEAIQKINKKLDALDGRLTTLQTTLKQKTTPDETKCLMLDVADAINNQRLEIAEEKLMELGDDNRKIAKIVHDAYAGSEVNVDRIVGFAKALKNGESQFIVFSAILDEMVSRGNAEPIKLIKLVQAFDREVARRDNKSLKTRAKKVINKAIEDIKVASVTIFQAAMIANKYEENAEINNLANALFDFRTEVFNDVMDRVVDSVFGVVAAGKILDNISSHKNIPQVIQGLTSIFNRFNYAGNLNNDATLNLASHLHKLQERGEYENLSQQLKDEVEKVIQQLPACARNLYFTTNVCLWNKAKQQYLYAGQAKYDGYHRHILTWYPGDIPPGALWHVTRKGDAFNLKNDLNAEEYLFSPMDNFSWDKDNRHAFTWIQGYNNYQPESTWGIELDGDYCYIKTLFNNEYLYASDVKYNELNSYVFTWRPGSLVRKPEFQWQIRKCGQA